MGAVETVGSMAEAVGVGLFFGVHFWAVSCAWMDWLILQSQLARVNAEELWEAATMRDEAWGDKLIPLESLPAAAVAWQPMRLEDGAEITLEQARFVRELRVEKQYTWRAVAQACHEAWGASWEPPSNQLWGKELCDLSAEALGQNPRIAPWN